MAKQNGRPARGAQGRESAGRRYLIAPRLGGAQTAAGLQPVGASYLRGLIDAQSGLDVVRVIRPSRAPMTARSGSDEANETYVVTMEPDQAEVLRRTAPAHVIVEEDLPLDLGAPAAVDAPPEIAARAMTGGVKPQTVKLKILGDQDRPVPRAVVAVNVPGLTVRGMTDEQGEVSLELYLHSNEKPRSIVVTASRDHWSCLLREPELSPSETKVIRLQSLEESIQGFPEHYHYGWGARLMGLDRIDRRFTGAGVRIAIVDSGVDNQHPLLKHIRKGADLTNDENPNNWCEDLMGHGTHCAGIIGARTESGSSLRGFAPDAEIHVLKVAPNGRISSLLEALDWCIQREIDLVNISLGTQQFSWVLEQKLQECALNGVACIAAAGSTGGPVQYPASSRWTLAASAMGKLNEIPATTWECDTVMPLGAAPDGTFCPSFACRGPEVAVCAPGVGIISTGAGGTFSVQSGTSTAAPHVTGLAALVLAHHPLFGRGGGRGPDRVAALFQTIASMCVPWGLGPGQTGIGVPMLDSLQVLCGMGAAVTPVAVPQGFSGANGANGANGWCEPQPGWTGGPTPGSAA